MIGDLSTASSLGSGDKFVIYSVTDGTYEAVTATQLKTWLQTNLTFSGNYVTQYSAPSATGFSVTIGNGSVVTADTHLILTPVAGYASGTVTLPQAAGCLDGQKVMVSCTQIVTTLTIGNNGATSVTGAPTTLAANAFFTLKFDKPSLTWNRVG